MWVCGWLRGGGCLSRIRLTCKPLCPKLFVDEASPLKPITRLRWLWHSGLVCLCALIYTKYQKICLKENTRAEYCVQPHNTRSIKIQRSWCDILILNTDYSSCSSLFCRTTETKPKRETVHKSLILNTPWHPQFQNELKPSTLLVCL